MIKVLLFATLQEKVGASELSLEENAIKISDLKNRLIEEYDVQEFSNCLVAINEEYAGDNDIAESGDTIAFIPPVSGG
ncbi:molybdopterin converting factor subunit 1 [Fictibacillus sp. Mic-4]|uniref:molybdopterin converting factor subunit 1 n=1 Tax=Fictibacillus TaxID=1329200 RepID=UPI000400B5CE|nr:molybdopterin converting factor subunit 1 [Fictibacillus gelatini]